MTRFQGTFTALVTPLRDDRVDEQALRDLVERQIAGGIDGLVPCGTTGEAPTLSEQEAAHVVRIVAEQARKRVPVVAGSGTASTRHTIQLSKNAREAGADGLLVVVPYYNRPSQAGLVAHYRAVLKEVPLPTILYNIPGRTGSDLGLDALGELASISALVGVKEATGNVLRSQQILARFGDRFDVLSGDDALTLGIVAAGGAGVISVTSNVLPREVSDVVRLARKGDLAAARALHMKLVPVHEAMFVESNPGPVKAAMHARGWLASEVRLPLVWPGEASVAKVKAALAAAGLAG